MSFCASTQNQFAVYKYSQEFIFWCHEYIEQHSVRLLDDSIRSLFVLHCLLSQQMNTDLLPQTRQALWRRMGHQPECILTAEQQRINRGASEHVFPFTQTEARCCTPGPCCQTSVLSLAALLALWLIGSIRRVWCILIIILQLSHFTVCAVCKLMLFWRIHGCSQLFAWWQTCLPSVQNRVPRWHVSTNTCQSSLFRHHGHAHMFVYQRMWPNL